MKSSTSCFYITVNSNVTEKAMEGKLMKAFETFYSDIVSYINYKDSKGSEKLLDEINCIAKAIEIGGKYNRVHLHVLIRIDHRTKIQLNYDKMRDFYKKALKLTSLHIDCEYVRVEDIEKITSYIRKYASQGRK